MDAATVTATAAAVEAAAPAASAFEIAYPFAISLALGALIGLERERKRLQPDEKAANLPGGIRTFPLIALLGCTMAWLGAQYGAAVFAVGLGGFAMVVVAVYVMTSVAGDLGMTTEVAAFLTFLLGAMVYAGEPLLASGLAVATTVILSARERLRDVVLKIETEDLYAALTLAVVTVIILPVLPDRGFGPYHVWNPFKIWLLVVFISAIGFAGYIGIKLLGPGRGIALAGLLGGLVSSTAATLTFSGRSKEAPVLSGPFALAIALAWGAMFGRVIAEVAVVDASLVPSVAPVIGAAGLVGVAGAGLLALRRHEGQAGAGPTRRYHNPFSLWSAIKFGLLFAAVLLVAKVAQVQFRDAGVYVAAVLTGLFDVDAITLTAARLSHQGAISHPSAACAVFLAAGANTVMKACLAVSLGAPALRRGLLVVALATLGAGTAAAFLLVPR